MSNMQRQYPGGSPWDPIDVLPRFSALPEGLRADLRAISTGGKFAAGETVGRDGDQIGFVGCVSSGVLKMTKTMPDGREQIVGLLLPGDMFGRVFGGPLQFTKVAASDLGIRKFPRAAFENLMATRPELENLVLCNLFDEIDNARDWMFVLRSQKTTERLAGFLLVLCRKWRNVGQTIRIENGLLVVHAPLRRTELADLLGVRHESLSRAVHELADQGVISIRSTYVFEILDFKALLELDRSETFLEKGTFDELSRQLGRPETRR